MAEGRRSLPDFSNHVYVQGDYAYVSNGSSGLRVVDVSDPANPVDVGSYAPPGIIAGGVCVSGDIAYLTNASEGVFEIDVSDPSSPVEVCFQGTPGDAFKPVFTGGLVYIADGSRASGLAGRAPEGHPAGSIIAAGSDRSYDAECRKGGVPQVRSAARSSILRLPVKAIRR